MRRQEFLCRNSALQDRTCSARLDESHVADPHKPEDETQVGHLVIQSAQIRTLPVAATARDNGEHLSVLSCKQAFWFASSGVPKGFPGSDHVVDPGSEGRRNGKVVHRSRKDDFIRFDKLGNQLVRERYRSLIVLILLLRWRERACNPVEVDKRKWSLSEIALNHAAAGI